jgi:hypothetical protein
LHNAEWPLWVRKQKYKLRHYRLSEGCSRSTWYRRRKAAREREDLAARAQRSQAMFERAEALAAALKRDLERCAMLHAVMARELEINVLNGQAHMFPLAQLDNKSLGADIGRVCHRSGS